MLTKEYVKQVLEETCGQYMQVTDEIAQQVFDGFVAIRNDEAVEHSVQSDGLVCTCETNNSARPWFLHACDCPVNARR